MHKAARIDPEDANAVFDVLGPQSRWVLRLREGGTRRHAAFLHGGYPDMKCFGLIAQT
jgi:hypothetical protein